MASVHENVIQSGKPSRTALRVAILRAAHQLLDEPIVFPDPIALPILGPTIDGELREDPFQYNDPLARSLRASIVVRSRFAEDELGLAVNAGVNQFVVLGAGLDTFAFRNPYRAALLRVFEVDHPSTQHWKRQLLDDVGLALPEALTFVPADFGRDRLADALLAAGFRQDQTAYFSWLGVTMYLTESAIMEVLTYVARLPRGSSIVFDYRASPELLNPIEKAMSDVMGRRAADLGEPWVSAFAPVSLREKVLALGFSEVTAYEPDELNRRYLHRRKDGLRSGGRLMCAHV
jgi:methyltransferase (TIGR00027 family)